MRLNGEDSLSVIHGGTRLCGEKEGKASSLKACNQLHNVGG
jgi:hypothetical protein